MIVGYIKCERKNRSFLQSLKRIEIEGFNNNYIIKILKREESQEEKNIKKLEKILKQYNIDTIVYSKNITKSLERKLKEKFSKSINTLTGNTLMRYLSIDILKYIMDKQKTKIEEEDIYIVLKNDDKNLNFRSNLEKLKSYLKPYICKFKLTNLISNDIRNLRKIQQEILEEKNILISISNNKRKALSRAKYIININLNKKELEKYKINQNGIIINLEDDVIYDKIGFSGININTVELIIPDEYIESFEEIGEFSSLQIYENIILEYIKDGIKKEDFIHNKMNFYQIIDEKIKKDNVKIKYLVGNNGKISDKEIIVNKNQYI